MRTQKATPGNRGKGRWLVWSWSQPRGDSNKDTLMRRKCGDKEKEVARYPHLDSSTDIYCSVSGGSRGGRYTEIALW